MTDPEVRTFILTPICPHSTDTYPIVLDEKRTIIITERSDSAKIYADGKLIGSINGELSIRVSGKKLNLYTDGSIIKNL